MQHSRDVRLREEVVKQEGVERGYGLLRRDVEWTDVRGRGLHREHHRLRRLPSRILQITQQSRSIKEAYREHSSVRSAYNRDFCRIKKHTVLFLSFM